MRGSVQGGSEAPPGAQRREPHAGVREGRLRDLVEELADVYLCSIVFFGGELDDNDPCNMCDAVGDRMVEIMEQKLARWKYRLASREEAKNNV